MSRYVILSVAAPTVFCTTASPGSGEAKSPPSLPTDDPHVCVNIRRFSNLVKADDWSAAFQAAIDSVCKHNGFEEGGTVLFPAGTYRIDRPLVVGGRPAHWGLRLLGYGATLVGTSKLDRQPLPDPEPEANGQGVPMLVLKSPEGTEGAGYCIEGLRLTRERERGTPITGVGISIPCGQKSQPNRKRVPFQRL